MVYEMRLWRSPFEKISSGRKTLELRLFDEKRRKLDIGDKIVFTNIDDSLKKIAVVVKSLHRYATFEDLFNDCLREKCGIDSSESPLTAASKMRKYYSDDQIQRFGVLGIEIELTDTVLALEQLKEQEENEFDRLFPDGMK